MPIPLSAWSDQFAALGFPAVVEFESRTVAWIEVAALRTRGYAVLEGDHVEAVNFELSAADPVPARQAIEAAAAALGWELDDENLDEDDGD